MRATYFGVLLLGVTSCVEATAPAERPANVASGLRVWATVSPASVSVRDSTRSISIRVYARNPGRDTLRIVSGGPPYVFTTDPRDSRGLSYQFRTANAADQLNAGPNADYWGQPEYVFAPHTTWYVEYRFSISSWRAGNWATTPGVYSVRSFYNGLEGEPAGFRLLP